MVFPDFSPLAERYARSRPGYPPALFDWLASLVDRRRLAWDCATGNGQAALDLVRHFERVIATDVSADQIRCAGPHPRVDYRVATAEQSGLEDGSADLITVAAALHWFDRDAFYAEAQRVLRPGGVLAAWTYHVGYVEPPLDELFLRFYRDVVSAYFAPAARLVDDGYRTLTLPGQSIEAGRFFVHARWTLDQMLAFIRSWSGTQRYIDERGEDPVASIAAELERIWGDPDRRLDVRWPLFARISRL